MELPPETTPPPAIPPTAPAQRHGCLTAWLILIIIGGIFSLSIPFSMSALAAQTGRSISPALSWILVLCGIVNIGCAIALFRWKKIGFIGIVATSIVALIINLVIGTGIAAAVSGLVGVAILYWVLNMGGPNKAWPRLQ